MTVLIQKRDTGFLTGRNGGSLLGAYRTILRLAGLDALASAYGEHKNLEAFLYNVYGPGQYLVINCEGYYRGLDGFPVVV